MKRIEVCVSHSLAYYRRLPSCENYLQCLAILPSQRQLPTKTSRSATFLILVKWQDRFIELCSESDRHSSRDKRVVANSRCKLMELDMVEGDPPVEFFSLEFLG